MKNSNLHKSDIGHKPILITFITSIQATEPRFQLIKNILDSEDEIDIDDKEWVTKRTALHYAAELNDRELVELLVERGARIDIQDSDGKSPQDLSTDEAIKSYLQNQQVLLDEKAYQQNQHENVASSDAEKVNQPSQSFLLKCLSTSLNAVLMLITAPYHLAKATYTGVKAICNYGLSFFSKPQNSNEYQSDPANEPLDISVPAP